jgi:hypothetical protein
MIRLEQCSNNEERIMYEPMVVVYKQREYKHKLCRVRYMRRNCSSSVVRLWFVLR